MFCGMECGTLWDVKRGVFCGMECGTLWDVKRGRVCAVAWNVGVVRCGTRQGVGCDTARYVTW